MSADEHLGLRLGHGDVERGAGGSSFAAITQSSCSPCRRKAPGLARSNIAKTEMMRLALEDDARIWSTDPICVTLLEWA